MGTWWRSCPPLRGLCTTGTCYLDLPTFQPRSLGQTWDLGLSVLSSPQGSESLSHPVHTEGLRMIQPRKARWPAIWQCWLSQLFQALPKLHTTCIGPTGDSQCDNLLRRPHPQPTQIPWGSPSFPTTSAASHLWVASLSAAMPSSHHPHTCAHMQGLGSEGLGGCLSHLYPGMREVLSLRDTGCCLLP